MEDSIRKPQNCNANDKPYLKKRTEKEALQNTEAALGDGLDWRADGSLYCKQLTSRLSGPSAASIVVDLELGTARWSAYLIITVTMTVQLRSLVITVTVY